MIEGLDDGKLNVEDCSKFISYTNLKDWKEDKVIQNIRDRFVTGDWSKAAQRNHSMETNDDDDEDAVFGDFEDLETGEKHVGSKTDDSDKETNDKEDEMTIKETEKREHEKAIQERKLKKLALRAKFDAEYPYICSIYIICYFWTASHFCSTPLLTCVLSDLFIFIFLCFIFSLLVPPIPLLPRSHPRKGMGSNSFF